MPCNFHNFASAASKRRSCRKHAKQGTSFFGIAQSFESEPTLFKLFSVVWNSFGRTSRLSILCRRPVASKQNGDWLYLGAVLRNVLQWQNKINFCRNWRFKQSDCAPSDEPKFREFWKIHFKFLKFIAWKKKRVQIIH